RGKVALTRRYERSMVFLLSVGPEGSKPRGDQENLRMPMALSLLQPDAPETMVADGSAGDDMTFESWSTASDQISSGSGALSGEWIDGHPQHLHRHEAVSGLGSVSSSEFSLRWSTTSDRLSL
ncbi:MAG: hypothetical protein ACJAQ3_003197, partial [Planctomycetota bacterium]